MTNNKVGGQNCIGVVGERASVKSGGLKNRMIFPHLYCIDHWSVSGIGVVLSSGGCVWHIQCVLFIVVVYWVLFSEWGVHCIDILAADMCWRTHGLGG